MDLSEGYTEVGKEIKTAGKRRTPFFFFSGGVVICKGRLGRSEFVRVKFKANFKVAN